MTEATIRNCYRCGASLLLSELPNFFVSPTISHQVDAALTVDWFCPGCFEIARHSERIRSRVYQRHDLIQYVSVKTINDTLHREPEERRKMRPLPNGLRCESEDFDRISELRGDYSAKGPLQKDSEALASCFKVLRNRNQCPYYIDESRSIVDYDGLKKKLEVLDRFR